MEKTGDLEPSPLDLYWNMVVAGGNGLVLSWYEGSPWKTSHLIKPLLRWTRFKKMRMLYFLSPAEEDGRLFSVFNRLTKNNSGSKIFPLRTKLFIFEKTNKAVIRATKDKLEVNYVYDF